MSVKDFSDTKPVGLYESAIGDKNQEYYLGKFEDFDDKGPGLHASWNWAAFFIPVFWVLYRKMYGWFVVWVCIFIFFGVADRAALNSAEGSYWVLAATFAVAVSFSAYANSLYHRKVKARIATAQKSSSDVSRLSRKLTAGGGVNKWVPLVCAAVPVIGVMAAVALPAYQDYTQRQVSGVNRPTTQQTPSPELKPFSGALDSEQKPDLTWTPKDQVSEDRKILKEQGIGGNQNLADVEAWANSQMGARFLNPAELQKAHDFALMWQRQIILKLRFSPERALFMGVTVVTNMYDQKKGICRPDMNMNGGIEDFPDGNFKANPECFVRR